MLEQEKLTFNSSFVTRESENVVQTLTELKSMINESKLCRSPLGVVEAP